MGGGSYTPSYSSKSKSSSSSKSSSYAPAKSSSSSSERTETANPVEPPAADAATKEAILSSFQHSADKTGIDIAFSFDTTGSMYPCLQEVRNKLQEITTRLLKDIPNIRIAFIAHGDFCDQNESYVIKAQDFSTDQKTLLSFVKEVSKTGGGDAPEAYELVLRDAQSLSWDPNHSKALIVIGDEIPHPARYTDQDIFWKDHVQKLADIGVAIYGVQALHNAHATPFYSEISTRTGGFHLHLRDFSLITEMFVAVCFRATSQEKFDEYQKQVEETGSMTTQVKQMLNEMAKPTEKKTFSLTEAWWDRQFDKSTTQYKWDAKTKKWVRL
jgi:hypothetical protein